ncbi:MAG TPA: SUMF1/EgtB/PvdO family nonheme iron enzyme [Planctomycetota bacterium]|nr:SUMF1/EgtB/PvdO family nonheme iron enzyme [Planctomycetota bacterium]
MSEPPAKPVSPRKRPEPQAPAFPSTAVLIGDDVFLRDAQAYFASQVRDLAIRTIPSDQDHENLVPLGSAIEGPWCLLCHLGQFAQSLPVARKTLLNSTNVPFVALCGDPNDLSGPELRALLELGITHVLPHAGSWTETWGEVQKILSRRLNPLLSVHSTRTWLVGVLQSIATEERNCCVRISSQNDRKTSRRSSHGTSLRISPVGLLGEIYFREGQPLYAWSTRLQGDEAIIDLLQTSNVQISVLESCWVPPVRNVQSPLQGVLLEFMRRKDLGQLEPTSTDDLPEVAPPPPEPPPLPPIDLTPPDRSGRLKRSWTILGAIAVLALVIVAVIRYAAPGDASRVVPAALPVPPVPVAAELPKPVPAKAEPPHEFVLPLSDRVTLNAVLIPAGRFRQGTPDDERGRDPDEGPVREVVIPAAFYLGRYEITQEQYEAVMGTNPSQFRGPRLPVESVSSFDAADFCEKASKKLGRELRLPTEAEWEYACRGGSTSPFHVGATLHSSDANLDGRAGSGGAPDGVYRARTLEVGSFAPNAFGLYDMHGNVGEWCLDHYDPKSYESGSSAPVPFSPSNPERVWRGGAWNDPPRRCRSGNRDHYNPGGRDSIRGFRVVIPVEPH